MPSIDAAREGPVVSVIGQADLGTADWDRAAPTAGQAQDPLDASRRPAHYEALCRLPA